MSTALDTEMAAAVTELLNEFGTTATLLSVTRGAYSPFGGAEAPSSTVSTTVKASPPENLVAARMSGRGVGATESDVLQTDLLVILDTVDTSGAAVPKPTPKADRLTVAGDTFAIWSVWEIRSGDDVAAYELQLRKS